MAGNPVCFPDPPSRPLHPLGGLPPEVWEKVLKNLRHHPETLVSCYYTCSTWKKILEGDKLNFLFQAVGSHLKEGYLPTSDLLKCRQICRNWRLVIDSSFATVAPLRKDFSVHSGIPATVWYNDTTGVVFNTAGDIRSFTRDIGSTPGGNPFFHKTIKCISRYLNNDPESNRLFQDFATLLSSHGPSIQRCVYLASGGRPESDLQMETLFTRLPNLTSLALLKQSVPLPPTPNYTAFDWLLRRTTLLPPLPLLTSLNIYLDDSPSIAEMLLLSYAPQLTSFHCDFHVISSCPVFQGPVPEHLQTLPNLTDLSIFDAFGDSQFLERLLHFNFPNLSKLSLEYIEHGSRRDAFKSILFLIDSCSASLQHLRLPQKLFNWESERQSDCPEFEDSAGITLPRVKKLGVNIAVLDCHVSHQWFLNKFPNLEVVCVTNFGVDYCPEARLRRELDKKLRRFWKWVPSLKRITVERAYLGQIHFFRRQKKTDENDNCEVVQ